MWFIREVGAWFVFLIVIAIASPAMRSCNHNTGEIQKAGTLSR
jgi:hypothetical protein